MTVPSIDLPTVDLDFTAQPPIPEEGIRRANELMASGRLFRYGESSAGESDVAALEAEFAALPSLPKFRIARLQRCSSSTRTPKETRAAARSSRTSARRKLWRASYDPP